MIPNPGFTFLAGMMIGGALRKRALHKERAIMTLYACAAMILALLLHF